MASCNYIKCISSLGYIELLSMAVLINPGRVSTALIIFCFIEMVTLIGLGKAFESLGAT